jgi:thiosulfate/3-mercaptopyruvate sulfurtransferase
VRRRAPGPLRGRAGARARRLGGGRGLRYRFVDCAWELGRPEAGRTRYLAGHIPGASFLDLDGELSDFSIPDAGRHPLPTAEGFASSASRAGIEEGVFVVAYDHGTGGGAARLWWLLRHFGHEDAAVLRGGIDAWQGPLRGGDKEAEPAAFVPRPREGDTIQADELLARLGEKGLVVVDARAPERYRGETEPIDPVAGRIPGAVNWPATEAGGPVPEEITRANEIVVYCGSGVSACVDLLALHAAGRADARLYPGSWSEWCRRGLPGERG